MGNNHLDLRDFTCLSSTIHCGPKLQYNVIYNLLIKTILTQYHVPKGLKIFGDTGVAAILKELKQLHDRMLIYLNNTDKITTCQKKAALQYLMFPKQKICRKIKGRGAQTSENNVSASPRMTLVHQLWQWDHYS